MGWYVVLSPTNKTKDGDRETDLQSMCRIGEDPGRTHGPQMESKATHVAEMFTII